MNGTVSNVVVEQRRWNVPGVLGFFLSALGLIGCCIPFFNLIAIPGLILSFIGVFRSPRVLATFGVVLGLIGSILAIIISIVMSMLMLLGQTFGGLGQFAHVAAINGGLEQYRDHAGAYPADLSQLPIDSDWRIDRWGNDFVYEPASDSQSYRLRSAGPDGKIDTKDDIEYSHLFVNRRWRDGHRRSGSRSQQAETLKIESGSTDDCEQDSCDARQKLLPKKPV